MRSITKLGLWPNDVNVADLVALADDLDADDSASVIVRDALRHTPSIAETLLADPHECGVPDQAAIDWLLAAGVTMVAIHSPIAIRAAYVRLYSPGRYEPSTIGDVALILPVTEAGELVDLCAWVPRTGEVATRLGAGALLGGECIGRPYGDGVTFPPIPVHRSPLGWLRANRSGSVILDPVRTVIMFSGAVIEAEDRQHGDELRKALQQSAPVIRHSGRPPA